MISATSFSICFCPFQNDLFINIYLFWAPQAPFIRSCIQYLVFVLRISSYFCKLFLFFLKIVFPSMHFSFFFFLCQSCMLVSLCSSLTHIGGNGEKLDCRNPEKLFLRQISSAPFFFPLTICFSTFDIQVLCVAYSVSSSSPLSLYCYC